jgi:hypothetical protein
MMFNLIYTVPSGSKGTIRVNKWPCGLGSIIDVDGVRWDIRGIFGWPNDPDLFYKGRVWACREELLHPYYTDTSGADFGYVSQRWNSYWLELHPNGVT